MRLCFVMGVILRCIKVRNRILFLYLVESNLCISDCYGVPYIPEGQWLCRKCTVSPEVPVVCSSSISVSCKC